MLAFPELGYFIQAIMTKNDKRVVAVEQIQ